MNLFFLLSLDFTSFIKIFSVFIFSGLKFAIAPPLSIEYGFNYFQTLIYTMTGGIAGVLFFFYLSKFLIYEYNKNKYSLIYYLRLHKIGFAPKLPTHKRKFTKRNRYIVKMSQRHGVISIAALTPILLSIPLGAFIAARYFVKHKHTPVYLMISVIIWSVIISTTYVLINPF